MERIELVRPDNDGIQQLTVSDAAEILQACQLYVSAIERYYPDAHADALRIFSDCAAADPSFTGMTDLFIKTMCR